MVRGKAKAAAETLRVPKDRDDAAKMLAEFGAAQRKIEETETAMNAKLLAVKTDFEAKAAPHVAEATALFDGIKLWCEANRALLTQDGKTKTVDIGSGKASWRWNPPKVRLTGEPEDIIQRIANKVAALTEAAGDGDPARAQAYQQFVRTKLEVDKEAMLKNPDLARTIDGVGIGRGGEMFELEPFGAELSEAAQ